MDKKLNYMIDDIRFCELEKARTACEELLEYFTPAEPDPCILLHCYDKYATFAHITLDYIVQAIEKLDAAREVFSW